VVIHAGCKGGQNVHHQNRVLVDIDIRYSAFFDFLKPLIGDSLIRQQINVSIPDEAIKQLL
jgi:hypothetical protein